MAINSYAADRAGQIAMDTAEISQLLEKLNRVQKNLVDNRDNMSKTFNSLDEKEAWDEEVSSAMHQLYNNSLSSVCNDCIQTVNGVINLINNILENNIKLQQQFVNMAEGSNAQSAQAAKDADYMRAQTH